MKCKSCLQILKAHHEEQKCVCGNVWISPLEGEDNFKCGWMKPEGTFHDHAELVNEEDEVVNVGQDK